MIELAGSAAHVVVEGPDSPGALDALTLADADRHHLARVLRLRAGEPVTATDGRGSWRWCRWSAAGGGHLEPDGPIGFRAAPAPAVGVGFALVKGDRVDWIVQKLTELGVDTIVPVTTQRCVVRWDGERAAAHLERLRRIAREAAMQSRRVWLPTVEPLAEASAVLARAGAARADFDGPPLRRSNRLESSLIVVGPEGGWSPTEREHFPAAVCLGDQVLRSETAAIVAGCLLVDRRHADLLPK